MKKIHVIFVFMLFSFAYNSTSACDVCGCSLGGNYYGILPQFSKNFVGLRWSQAKFYAHMNHNSEYLAEEYSNDTYNTMELWGRYYINKKFQVFAFVPYSFNNMNGTEQVVSTHGLGDITVLGNYLILNNGKDTTSRFKHSWMIGGGVKLPTGDNDLSDKGKLVNPNFQMGTGSTDFLVSTVYTVRYQRVGLNTEVGYKINTRNPDKYLFGNQFHAATQLFYWQNIKSFSFLPNVGVYYEQASKHRNGSVIQTNTGGSALLATVGLETYFKNFTVGINYKHPLTQSYNSDAVAGIQSKDRWMVSFTYSF